MPNTSSKSGIFHWDKLANRLLVIVGIGIVLNLLFTYYISDGFQWAQLVEFSVFWLLAAVFLAVFPWLCHAVEIRIWTTFFKNPASFKDCLRISVATDLGSAITPTMIGGGPIKIGMLVKAGLPLGQATAMLTLAALEDLFFFLVIIPASFVFTDHIGLAIFSGFCKKVISFLPNIWTIIMAILLLIVIAFIILKKFSFREKLRHKIQTIFRDFRQAFRLIMKEGKMHFAGATTAIFLRWTSRFFILVCLLKGLELQVNSKDLFFSQWLIDLAMTVTPTPGAVGGAEGAFYLVFKSIIPASHIGLIMTIWRFISYYMLLILAAIFLNIVKINSKVNVAKLRSPAALPSADIS